MKSTIVGITLALALGTTGGLAQRIENRKAAEAARTRQGVQSGELTAREATRLRAEQRQLNQRIQRDRQDGGRLTVVERARIEKRQDEISRQLYRQKHDAQTRP